LEQENLNDTEKQNKPVNNDNEKIIEETNEEQQNCEKSPVEKNISKIEELTAELENFKEKFLRMAAEYENFRKRTEKEKILIYSDAMTSSTMAILPILDSFDLAFNSIKNGEKSYENGMEAIKNQIKDVFKKLKIKSYGKIGETFDPNFHNAVSHIKDEGKNENVISEVFQKGYKLGEKVIRYAMVQVTN
jgi:molecular chaperone GrpE